LALLQAFRELGDLDRAGRLVDAARRRHGAVVDQLARALREELRRKKIFRLRKDVHDPELRFFLALLLNLPSQEAIYGLVRRRYPEDDPRERVLVWARALSGVDRIGVDIDDDLNHHLLHALLDGCKEEAVLSRLRDEFEPEDVDAQIPALQRHCERLRR